ncbi:metal ABC transporter permease [Desulfobacterota bacterium AH_259_B03_O07]|nr:metal ABC transporter permease [Desulfobacterota bacterium AH_259_B03_O07]
MELILALIIGTVVGGVAGYLGTLMVTKRMSLMGGALGHMALPGIALALIYGFDISIGALVFLAFGVILIWLLERKTKLPMEALTAIVFSSSLAIAFLFLPEEETTEALIGDISRISITDTSIAVAVAVIIFFVTKRIFSDLVFVSISEDLAQVSGISISKTNLVYLVCIALVVAIGVKVVGGLLTAALVAIPASASKNISRNLFQYSYGGLILGSAAGILGILAFKFTGVPAGPLIILTSTIFFLISLIFVK